MSEDRGQVRCGCGIPATKRTSWTERNPGRRFISCKFFDADTETRKCEFFKWLEEDMTEWQRHLINKLILEKKLLDVQLSNSEDELKELQRQRSFLLSENDNLKTKCKLLNAEMKLRKKGISKCLNMGRVSGSVKLFAMLVILVVVVGVVVTVV